VSHKIPSVICWKPKKRGIAPKRICEGLCTFLIVAIPIAEMIIPPAKLAPAEKHINIPFC
jgi:hypothetical protein